MPSSLIRAVALHQTTIQNSYFVSQYFKPNATSSLGWGWGVGFTAQTIPLALPLLHDLPNVA